MAEIADISKLKFEELRKNPVFFLKFSANYYEDYKTGKQIDNSKWISLDRDLNISFDAGNFANRELKYALCILEVGKEITDDKGNKNSDNITIRFHSASPNSVDDWIYIINCFIIRTQIQEDKYAFMELLWAVDRLFWKKETLILALSRYTKPTLHFLLNKFQEFGRILSYNKQLELKSVVAYFKGHFDINLPEDLKQAYECVHKDSAIPPQRRSNIEQMNRFSIIDAIFHNSIQQDTIHGDFASNEILKIFYWLKGNYHIDDYTQILNVFPYLSENIRLLIVKRYFHDIRNNRTSFDVNFLKNIKDNRLDDIIRYRYCIESPAEPIALTVPLLCDTVINLYNSGGNSFQEFNGVLDLAMTRCDTVHPAIDFGIERLLPKCNNGIVYNIDNFKGFIDYALIRKLNDDSMSDEHLMTAFVHLMDMYAYRQTYPVCIFGDGTKIPDNIFEKCQKRRKYKNTEAGKENYIYETLKCFRYQTYNDRWNLRHNDLKPIQEFLKEVNILNSQTHSISLDMLSTDKLKKYIMGLPSKFVQVKTDEFLVHSYNRQDVESNFDLYLIEEFSEILRMRIFPQQGVFVGLQCDIFGFWKDIRQTLPAEVLCDQQSDEYKEARKKYEIHEAQEVRERCLASLKRYLNSKFTDEGFFELPYDRKLLSDTLKLFYFKGTIDVNDNLHYREFLKPSNLTGKFTQYCAPQLSENNNPAIDLPYFWCRGKECFHNNLGTQTLEEECNWENYTLFHLSEIIGYPKLHKTVAGYEPDQSIIQFIAITNKVMKKFRQLKCRVCGHMIFTNCSSSFHLFNNFACANPTCAEVGKNVYLNFCFKCKKGLIDSRDTKKCPNGWYICPTCLACCDDSQYERMAQRYILTNSPVPKRILEKRGHGHNDKGEYFCPKCGHPIQEIEDEHGNTFNGCPVCNINFDAQPDGFYN